MQTYEVTDATEAASGTAKMNGTWVVQVSDFRTRPANARNIFPLRSGSDGSKGPSGGVSKGR